MVNEKLEVIALSISLVAKYRDRLATLLQNPGTKADPNRIYFHIALDGMVAQEEMAHIRAALELVCANRADRAVVSYASDWHNTNSRGYFAVDLSQVNLRRGRSRKFAG